MTKSSFFFEKLELLIFLIVQTAEEIFRHILSGIKKNLSTKKVTLSLRDFSELLNYIKSFNYGYYCRRSKGYYR